MVGLFDNCQKDWHTPRRRWVPTTGRWSLAADVHRSAGHRAWQHSIRCWMQTSENWAFRNGIYADACLFLPFWEVWAVRSPKLPRWQGGGNHCRGGYFPHRNPAWPGAGWDTLQILWKKPSRWPKPWTRSPGFCGLSRQMWSIAGICGRSVAKIDLLSDQTSCHATHEGGYCPVGLTFEERTQMLHENPSEFRCLVDALGASFQAIKGWWNTARTFRLWELLLWKPSTMPVWAKSLNGDDKNGFIFPSYGRHNGTPELFDYGYGPFRWVCLSGKHEDLVKTDRAAMECIDPIHVAGKIWITTIGFWMRRRTIW